MKVYKDFYVEDMLELLYKAQENHYISNDCVDSELASELYYFMEETMEEPNEDNIYDFIRFEMELQTSEEVKEYYGVEVEEGEDIHEIIEDYLYSNTTYIGNYKDSVGDLVHIFASF